LAASLGVCATASPTADTTTSAIRTNCRNI
jgi:hypothetical protein